MHTKTIGETAGIVWKTLGAKGKTALTALPKLVDLDAAIVQQAVGWLAREHKVEFETQGKAILVKLTAHEADVFKMDAAK